MAERGTATEKWTPYSGSNLPEKNRPIEWLTPSGEVVQGKYLGGVVWFPDGSDMYIYYTPTYWRYRDAD